ncbi:MAG: inositol monophosphatase family protein [Acidimicrobiales bacterium]
MSTEAAGGASGTITDAWRVDAHLRRLAGLVLPRLREIAAHRERLIVSSKSAAYDLVSDADRSIEASLWEETHLAFPEDGFLGEEQGWRQGPTRRRDWVVDPIDGTVNFVNGLPWACCAIAALGADDARAGAVIDPFREEVYLTSSPDGGSELNGEPMKVATAGDLAGKVVLLEVPSGCEPRVLDPVARSVLGHGGSSRMMGSGALALALVAAGRAQAVVHAGPCIWDVAAGVALVRHAGGVVLGGTGPYDRGAPGPLVAGNAESCQVLQEALAQCDLSSLTSSPGAFF